MTVDITFSQLNGVFQGWKVREGLVVRAAAVLMAYKDEDSIQHVKTDSAGVVQSLAKLKSGDKLVQGQYLLQLRPCDHPVVMKDLCADCGEDLRKREGMPGERVVQTQARVAMIHHIPELQITPEEAKSYGTADERNLLKQRRLVLLVDLDQTLIHTTNEDVNPKLKDVFHFQLYGSNSRWYHTRLRPRTRHFLETISKLYELHICTFGARLYAHTVAKILDAEGKLFGHRILSREECFDANLKIANLKALFPCGDRLVCIIDDREDVWNFAPNVVHVKPYRFFKHTGDINAPPGFAKNDQSQDSSYLESANIVKPSDGSDPTSSGLEKSYQKHLEQADLECATTAQTSDGVTADESMNNEVAADHRDEDDDDYLYHLEDILVRIHTAFYQMYDQLPADERPPDLKSVVPYVKNKVLRKCNIVFSGVVPTSVPLESSQIYKAAVAFGANVQRDIVTHHGKHRRSTATTHLVAAKWGTAKMVKASKVDSVKIVTPDWLWCCVERWEREDERLFELKKDTNGSESKRYQRPDGDYTPTSAMDETQNGSDDIVQVPTGESANQEIVDLEPSAKKARVDESNGDETDGSTSSSSSSSTNKTSKSESDASLDADEEIAEALERVIE